MSLKIIFMGTPKFAVPTLEALHKSEHLLVSTYSQNPKKSNRGQKINKSEIQQFAESLKLEVRKIGRAHV